MHASAAVLVKCGLFYSTAAIFNAHFRVACTANTLSALVYKKRLDRLPLGNR